MPNNDDKKGPVRTRIGELSIEKGVEELRRRAQILRQQEQKRKEKEQKLPASPEEQQRSSQKP